MGRDIRGIGLLDPPSIGLAIVVLAVSGIVAGDRPAQRASRVAPLEATRADEELSPRRWRTARASFHTSRTDGA